MTNDQWIAVIETFLGGAIPGLLLHLFGVAGKTWARGLLSILPDIIGMIRRARGLAGAPGAPKPTPVPPAALALLLLPFLGCGAKQEQARDIAACLAQFNGELGGQSTCDAIVRSIAVVLARDPKCSELLLHGLQCGKDGG